MQSCCRPRAASTLEPLRTEGVDMARRLPPRDSRGRFTKTGTPLWFIALVVVIGLVWAYAR
ncbi:hypothetical protein FM076_09990 [Streptomyces albus subsp. chlorinus]|nr:hypothetical protein [Streptomyces albus subsp. chlorinus]